MVSRKDDCRWCGLWRTRRCVVRDTGAAVEACDLLVIGIAPGASEDLRGQAFTGRSGWLLHQALNLARAAAPRVRVRLTNLVACRPPDEDDPRKNRDPRPDELAACRPYLEELLAVTRPKRIVLLGDLVARELRDLCPDGARLRHPSYILRVDGMSTQSRTFRLWAREMRDVFTSLNEKGGA